MKKPRFVEAVRLDAGMSALTRWRAQRRGLATFARLNETAPERRSERRRETRLKWGKALDAADRFICDCIVADRTEGGARLGLTRNVVLPPRFQFFDEARGEIFAAQVVWRRGGEVGCRLSRSPTPGKTQAARRMRSRWYAL